MSAYLHKHIHNNFLCMIRIQMMVLVEIELFDDFFHFNIRKGHDFGKKGRCVMKRAWHHTMVCCSRFNTIFRHRLSLKHFPFVEHYIRNSSFHVDTSI